MKCSSFDDYFLMKNTCFFTLTWIASAPAPAPDPAPQLQPLNLKLDNSKESDGDNVERLTGCITVSAPNGEVVPSIHFFTINEAIYHISIGISSPFMRGKHLSILVEDIRGDSPYFRNIETIHIIARDTYNMERKQTYKRRFGKMSKVVGSKTFYSLKDVKKQLTARPSCTLDKFNVYVNVKTLI